MTLLSHQLIIVTAVVVLVGCGVSESAHKELTKSWKEQIEIIEELKWENEQLRKGSSKSGELSREDKIQRQNDRVEIAGLKSQLKRTEEELESNKKGWDTTYANFKALAEQNERLIAKLEQLEGNGGVKIKTIQEWGPILHGKSMQEIKTLLGAPDRTYQDGQQWSYDDAIKQLPSGVIKPIYITFAFNNKVAYFQLEHGGQAYRPSAFR